MRLTESLLLDVLPDGDRAGITTVQMREKLQSRGIETTWLKTIRRALQRLENEGLAYSTHQGRHLYWWRQPGVGGIDANAQKRMGLGEALALRMLDVAAQAYQLPWVVRSELNSMFNAAQRRLEKTPIGDAHRTWGDRVAVLDEGLSRLPAPANTDVAEITSMALFKALRLSLQYSDIKDVSRGKELSHSVVVEPLGWVSRNKLHYLVAKKLETGQIRHYRIDRIRAAKLGRPFLYPRDFSLKRHVGDEAAFDYPG